MPESKRIKLKHLLIVFAPRPELDFSHVLIKLYPQNPARVSLWIDEPPSPYWNLPGPKRTNSLIKLLIII